MKIFNLLILFFISISLYAGTLTEGGGGGTKEPTITRGRMVMEKSNGLGIEKPSVEIKDKKILVNFLIKL
jgi:hypothetical protein